MAVQLPDRRQLRPINQLMSPLWEFSELLVGLAFSFQATPVASNDFIGRNQYPKQDLARIFYF